jgi:hypothetical protein
VAPFGDPQQNIINKLSIDILGKVFKVTEPDHALSHLTMPYEAARRNARSAEFYFPNIVWIGRYNICD